MTERMFERQYMGLTFITTARTSGIFREDLSCYKKADFVGKAVLDLGGLNGETAVLFHHWGASHVTVVEGAPENVPIIAANLRLHGVPSKIVLAMVGDRTEVRTVGYNYVDGGYGLRPRGTPKHTRDVSFIAMEKVLRDTGPVDIVKADIEGGEVGFATVPRDLLRRAPTYLMEVHGWKLARVLEDTFASAGFRTTILDGIGATRPFFVCERIGAP